MLLELFNVILLNLAIALSWVRFRTIFSPATEHAILLSSATTLATTIFLAASAFAMTRGLVVGGATIVLGLTLAPALERLSISTMMRLALATLCLWIAVGARSLN